MRLSPPLGPALQVPLRRALLLLVPPAVPTRPTLSLPLLAGQLRR
jgi:hypothetical protein